MTRNDVIARLAADLQPVRAQNLRIPFAWLSAICAVELLGFIAMGLVRQDFGHALFVPMFWWKCVACGVIALSSSTRLERLSRYWNWLMRALETKRCDQ